jgi:hypothetical protein
MINIPEQNFKQIQEIICRPEGSLTFNYSSPDLFNEKVLDGVLLEIPSGQHFFRLERDNQLHLHYYHSSPGTGTRVATIDLKKLTPPFYPIPTYTRWQRNPPRQIHYPVRNANR